MNIESIDELSFFPSRKNPTIMIVSNWIFLRSEPIVLHQSTFNMNRNQSLERAYRNQRNIFFTLGRTAKTKSFLLPSLIVYDDVHWHCRSLSEINEAIINEADESMSIIVLCIIFRLFFGLKKHSNHSGTINNNSVGDEDCDNVHNTKKRTGISIKPLLVKAVIVRLFASTFSAFFPLRVFLFASSEDFVSYCSWWERVSFPSSPSLDLFRSFNRISLHSFTRQANANWMTLLERGENYEQ